MSHVFSQLQRVVWASLILASVGLVDQAAGADGSLRLVQLVDEMQNIGIDTESDSGKFLRSTPRERSAARSREVREIRIAQQFGLGYLPLMLVRQYGLIEKHARNAGLGDVRVVWSRFPSGKVMNDALRTGLLDIASGGVAPMVRAWDMTRGGAEVKGVMSLSSMPMYLSTVNPRVRSLTDFGEADRIALPAVGSSGQAVVLQMAAAQAFGSDQATRLDPITVSKSHPEAMEAMLAGRAGITAHLASPPFQYQELDDPRVRLVFNSYSILGGMSTLTLLWTRENFYLNNPRTVKVVFDAVQEAMDRIQSDPTRAAKNYILQTNSDLSADYLARLLSNPQIAYSPVPMNVMKFAGFMFEQATTRNQPDNWRELFFDLVHGEEGS